MFEDGALFGENDTATTPADPGPETPPGIADWQVAQLRRALDACGLEDMTARQELIERLAGRPVASLRDLSSSEARTVSEQLNKRALSATPASRGSSWDDRDQDTWIDRL